MNNYKRGLRKRRLSFFLEVQKMRLRKALTIVEQMRNELYKSPEIYQINSVQFAFQSYRKWAMDELRLYLLIRSDQNPIERIEEFRYQMDIAATSAKTDSCNFMFSIAYDVASDVLDVLLV